MNYTCFSRHGDEPLRSTKQGTADRTKKCSLQTAYHSVITSRTFKRDSNFETPRKGPFRGIELQDLRLKFSCCKVHCNSSKTTTSDSSLVQHISGTKCLTLYGRVVYPARARNQISVWGPEDKTINWSLRYYHVHIKKNI